MANIELFTLSAARMAAAIRAREISPVEITQALLDRIAALDPLLNAFVTVTADMALSTAKRAEAAVLRGDALGPLHGVPLSLKDSFALRGVRTTFGSKLFATSVAAEDAPLVERIKHAGAVILGKTTMPEFAWKAVTHSPLSGITRNPWNLGLSSGGSSGGAAAQVAAAHGAACRGYRRRRLDPHSGRLLSGYTVLSPASAASRFILRVPSMPCRMRGRSRVRWGTPRFSFR